MNNFTTNTYEMKREIVNFSKKISEGVNKPTKKFVGDMQYGLAKSGSTLISEIARSLDEDIKLGYTIERLCDNLANLYSDEKEIIWNNYLNEVKKNIDLDNSVVLFDDSDINKEYSKKLEDLDRVIDASSQDKKIVNGYHVCEATILTKNQKQPMSIYSQIYSCKSKNFISKNTYTLESIKAAENVVGKDLVLVGGNGSIGTQNKPFAVTLTGDLLNARSNEEVNLQKVGSDNFRISAIYSPKAIRITNNGGGIIERSLRFDDISAAYLNTPGEITLTGTAGTANNPILIRPTETTIINLTPNS